MGKTERFVVAGLIASLLCLSSASAYWLMYLNCDDLAQGKLTPQNTFRDIDPVCFYGGNFSGSTAVISLENNQTKRIHILTVDVINNKVSSTEGYYFLDLETGFFHFPVDCSDLFGCRNQDGRYGCVPTDTSCRLVKFSGPREDCTEITEYTERDLDNDNWSDSCDAFSTDPLEQIDIDLDSIGNSNDNNDFDSTVITLKDPSRNRTANKSVDSGIDAGGNSTTGLINDTGGNGGGDAENNTNGSNDTSGIGNETAEDSMNGTGEAMTDAVGSGGGGGGGRRSRGGSVAPPANYSSASPLFPNKQCTPEYECTFWSACVDGKQIRTCSIINNCTNEKYPPVLEMDCPSGSPQSITAAENESQPAGLVSSAITGFAAMDIGGRIKPLYTPDILLIVGCMVVLGVFVFLRRKKIT